MSSFAAVSGTRWRRLDAETLEALTFLSQSVEATTTLLVPSACV